MALSCDAFNFQLDIRADGVCLRVSQNRQFLKSARWSVPIYPFFWLKMMLDLHAYSVTESNFTQVHDDASRYERYPDYQKRTLNYSNKWRNKEGTNFPKRKLPSFRKAKEQPDTPLQICSLNFSDQTKFSGFFKRGDPFVCRTNKVLRLGPGYHTPYLRTCSV